MSPKPGADIPGRSPKAMSPIHTLPVELLSRVFILGQPDTPYPEFPQDGSPTFEVLVTHVCRHWREVAIETQSLWTTVHFRLKSHMCRSLVYLSRNKIHHIDILVDTCAEDEYEEGYNLFRPEFMEIFNPLMGSVVARWRSFALKVRDKVCKLGARTILSTCGTAPKLEYLQLWHIENWDSAERLFTQIGPPPVVIFNKELPSLQHLSLIGVNVPWQQVNFLEDLTTIEFALHSTDVRIPYDVWANMLKTSPRLEKLLLHYSGPKPGDFPWPNDLIPLPGMKELSLTDLDAPYLCDILRHLHMPNLASLRLELPAEESGQIFAELIDELVSPKRPASADPTAQKQPAPPAGPMFPRLATLAVHALECTPADFRRLLEAVPTVTRLDLGGARLDAGLVGELLRVSAPAEPAAADKGKGRAPYAGVLLPDLDTVHVSGVSSATLLEWAEFRRAQGRPVRTWLVSERMRDAALERAAAEMEARGEGERVEWFKAGEDEEDESEDGDEDAEGYTDDGQEDDYDEVAEPEKVANSDDERVEYSDDG